MGVTFLEKTPWLPIFAAGAADDQYDANVPELMQWMLALSGNPRNTFSGFKDGKHGTEIFGPHPELPKQIVKWYDDTLVRQLADPKVAVTPKNTPMRDFWHNAENPDRVSAAAQIFHDARQRDQHVIVFPESALNLLGYQHLQAGKTKAAIELFKLNTEAYPTSANTYDSLGDGYLADGQNDLALKASQTAIETAGGRQGRATIESRPFAPARKTRSPSSREPAANSRRSRPQHRERVRPAVLAKSWDAPELAQRLNGAGCDGGSHVGRLPAELLQDVGDGGFRRSVVAAVEHRRLPLLIDGIHHPRTADAVERLDEPTLRDRQPATVRAASCSAR